MSALPNDGLAEQALLGHTLHLGRIPEGVNGLAPGDFYRPVNETIWHAIRSLADQEKPVDITAVRAHLQHQGKLNTREGVPDLTLLELMQASRIGDPAHTAGIIREHSQRRRVILLHQRGLQQAHDPTSDPEALLHSAEEELGRMRGSGQKGERASWPRLELAQLLCDDRPEREMVVYGLIPAGTSVALVAPAGNKKSLFLLALSIAIARGDRAFAGLRITRRRVLYVDMENTEDDLSERLRDLGVRPEDVAPLDNLILLHLPPLAPLDTPRGGQEIAAIVNAYELQPGDVVVLDSYQRVTQGAENDSDTTRAYYNCTGIGLKRRGLTVIRTDNTGKDASAGARGSSGKRDDVDIELLMTKITDDRSEIKPGKVRISGIETLVVDLQTDEGSGRICFNTAGDPFRALVAEAIEALDRHGIDPELGENKQWDALRAKGVTTFTRKAVRAAVKERKAVPRPYGTGTSTATLQAHADE
jgi:KaiC/GvpD/RAD55 family RecA-like ATPase